MKIGIKGGIIIWCLINLSIVLIAGAKMVGNYTGIVLIFTFMFIAVYVAIKIK